MTRLCRVSIAAMLLLSAAVGAAPPPACQDRTPHKVQMVPVAPGVNLEVLDWGGSGEAMVLLTGVGDNAHVYDQFAFQFTDYFHVIGITRRGYRHQAYRKTATMFRRGWPMTSQSLTLPASTAPSSLGTPSLLRN